MRQERCGTLLLMNWHVSNLCLHPLAFLNVYIEVSALSRNHAEELEAVYFLSQENSTKIFKYTKITNEISNI